MTAESSPIQRSILHQTPVTFPQQRTQMQQRTLPFFMSITQVCFVSSLLLTPDLKALPCMHILVWLRYGSYRNITSSFANLCPHFDTIVNILWLSFILCILKLSAGIWFCYTGYMASSEHPKRQCVNSQIYLWDRWIPVSVRIYTKTYNNCFSFFQGSTGPQGNPGTPVSRCFLSCLYKVADTLSNFPCAS